MKIGQFYSAERLSGSTRTVECKSNSLGEMSEMKHNWISTLTLQVHEVLTGPIYGGKIVRNHTGEFPDSCLEAAAAFACHRLRFRQDGETAY